MDPELIFKYGHRAYLNSIKYNPSRINIFEVNHFPGRWSPRPIKTIEGDGIKSWLENATKLPRRAIGGFRLIFGPAPQDLNNAPRENYSLSFPHKREDMEAIQNRDNEIPVSREDFELILHTFKLPATTSWCILSPTSHFQQYSMIDSVEGTPLIGFTMRRPTRGILAMDITLSISYNVNTGLTCAMLLGCTQAQQAFVCQQLQQFASLTCHPLLLPVLLSSYQQKLLNEQTRSLWEALISVETRSGQTGAPKLISKDDAASVDKNGSPSAPGSGSISPLSTQSLDKTGFNDITKDILGVIQLADTWQSYTEALILGIESIGNTFKVINGADHDARKTMISKVSPCLTQWLEFTHHISKVMLSDIQFINGRAQAQMDAVYNYMTQQISAAAKRDSSAMKGIAVLTMFFLPGTFMATFFSMPLFDFAASDSRSSIVRPQFWYYWVTTVPLTLFVLCLYLVYSLSVERQYREGNSIRPTAHNDKSSTCSLSLLCGKLPKRHRDPISNV